MKRYVFAFVLSGLCVAAHAEGMKPGLWEISTQMSGGGMAVSTRLCVTPEQAKGGVPPTSREDADCKQTDVRTSGKTTSWKFVCSGKQKASGSGSVTFENAERYSGESTVQVQDTSTGPMTMQNKFSGKWLAAACK